MKKLPKLKKGDKVGIVSPSSAAPGKWPQVYQLGLRRIKEEFGLIPVEYPSTTKVDSSTTERARDLIAAFEDTSIKAVITSIGGDGQVDYVYDLPSQPFSSNPKPFFGFSDNSHLANFLWLNNVSSFYGGALFTQFAMQGGMDEYTKKYLKDALFGSGEHELIPSEEYTDIDLSWDDESALTSRRVYEKSDGWYWSGKGVVGGILWGGCLESIDEMLQRNVQIPTLEQFENIVLMLETSEELPSASYVTNVLQSLGERKILSKVRAVLVGRPKAWAFDKQITVEEKTAYRNEQRAAISNVVEVFNPDIPLIQNMNFGHTDPQIPMPYGSNIKIDAEKKRMFANF